MGTTWVPETVMERVQQQVQTMVPETTTIQVPQQTTEMVAIQVPSMVPQKTSHNGSPDYDRDGGHPGSQDSYAGGPNYPTASPAVCAAGPADLCCPYADVRCTNAAV